MAFFFLGLFIGAVVVAGVMSVKLSELEAKLQASATNISFLSRSVDHWRDQSFKNMPTLHDLYNVKGWKLYPTHKPPTQEPGECKNYPVAFYDAEIGLIVEQAEYHASWPVPWVFVSDGRACHPYAWYDLPDPPEPPTSSDCGGR